METFIVYVNDADHAQRQVVPLLQDRSGDHWVLVACPPRLNRHSGRWVSQPALRRWKQEWARDNLRDLVALIEGRDNKASTRVAHGDLVAFTRQLRGELGAARILDARRPKVGVTLEAVTPEQPAEQQGALAAAGGALALGALIALATE